MRLTVCTPIGALALAALFTPTAHAQNLAQEVTSGSRAPHTVPLTIGNEGARVLKSEAEARNARMYDLIPPSWMFRAQWSQDMYLMAVDQRSGGPGAVAITVERKSLFEVAFFSVRFLQVTVKRLVPPPGTLGTPSTIRPYALVKMPRSDEPIRIRVRTETLTAPPPPPPGPAPRIFTAVVRVLTAQPAISVVGPVGPPTLHRTTEHLDVRADGQVLITRWSTPGPTNASPLTGTATAAELQALDRALRRARLNGIPGQLGGVGFPHFTLTGLGLPAGDKTIVGVRGQEGAFKPQLDGVHAALDAIRDRLIAPPAPTPQLSFHAVSRTTRFPLQRRRTSIRVDAAGNATLTIRRRNRPRRAFTGSLTADEARRLSQAVRRSHLRFVPSDLPAPIHVAPGDTFELTVDARRPRNTNTVRGEIDHYGQHAASVQPIMDVLDAITRRLSSATSGPLPLGGGGLTGGLTGSNP